MSDRDVLIRVENLSKLYRLGEVGTGSLAHDVNRWWHKVRGKEDPYLKIGEVNDRTKSVSSVQRPASSAKNANALAPQPSTLDSTPSSSSRPLDPGLSTPSSSSALAPQPSSLDSTSSSSSRPLDPGLSTPSSSALAPQPSSLDSTPSSSSRQLDPGLSTPSSSALDSRPSTLDSPKAPPSDWVYALKDVSFEVKRGELRTLGRSEKEISKKCLGATKVPDFGRRRHQLPGIIGRNGAWPAALAVAGKE